MVKSGQGKLAKSPGVSKPRAKRIGATLGAKGRQRVFPGRCTPRPRHGWLSEARAFRLGQFKQMHRSGSRMPHLMTAVTLARGSAAFSEWKVETIDFLFEQNALPHQNAKHEFLTQLRDLTYVANVVFEKVNTLQETSTHTHPRGPTPCARRQTETTLSQRLGSCEARKHGSMCPFSAVRL